MLEFRILGSLEVSDGSDALPLRGARERALLAYLLLHANEIVPSDRIIDDIWGDEPPQSVASMLQVYISRLRKVLNQNGKDGTGLLKEPSGYVLRIEDSQLDLHRFESLARTGKELLASGNPQGAARELRAALALWRGTPLADLANEPWAETEIARLQESRLAALEERIDADIMLGRHNDVVPELEKLVAEHPLRERPRAQLMLALYRSGRQAEALHHYDDARRLLAEQLGLEPGPTLKRLQSGILAQEPGLELERTESDASPRRRRSLLAIAFAAAVVITGAIIAALFVGRSHPALKALHSVPPDSVGVIDVKSNRLVDAVSIGGRISGIAYGADSIWVGDYDGQTLIRIDPSTAKITNTVALPGRPTDIVFAAGRVWVSSASAGLLIRVDPRYDTIDRRIHLHQAIYNQGIRPLSAPMTAGRYGLWIGHDISALTRIDPERATIVKQLALDAPVLALAEGANDVWALTGGEGRLVAVNPFSNTVEGSIPVAGATGPVAVGPEAVWTASNWTIPVELWRIDPVTRSPTAIIHLDGQYGLSGIAVGAGGVWIARQSVSSVSRIDPRTNRVVTTIHVGDEPQELIIVGNRIWVTVSSPLLP
jgi:DNA-binding SARP family transcriptional activator/streptogramin lyase